MSDSFVKRFLDPLGRDKDGDKDKANSPARDAQARDAQGRDGQARGAAEAQSGAAASAQAQAHAPSSGASAAAPAGPQTATGSGGGNPTPPGKPAASAAAPRPQKRTSYDDSEKSIDELMKRVAVAGSLLTGAGGAYERRPEQREIMALFDTGLFLVSKSHLDDPHLASFEGLLRRKGMEIEKIAVDMAVIRQVYDTSEGKGSAMRGEAGTTTMQRDILRFIADAAKTRASDAHIVVDREKCMVRLRVDGVVRAFQEWRSVYGQEFCAATFAMADASDASYQPYEFQGARISDSTIRLPEGVQAVRLQFNPLAYGGRHLVMRFLYRGSAYAGDVDSLGYSEEQIGKIRRMRALPLGINIIAGPTGSGKSTTLQRSLSSLMRERNFESSVLTVEDPPEYVIEGAQQMPVTNAPTPEERAVKFHQAIIAALRSDPDVIMIGEVRDRESAKLAFEASMTGHQVWTTLHATDALTIISRLKDIGVEQFKLMDPTILTGLVGQRLVRRLCPNCAGSFLEARERGLVADDLWMRVRALYDGRIEPLRVRGPGCGRCNGAGVIGRTVVAEAILPDDGMMRLLYAEDKPAARAYWLGHQQGQNMMMHGLQKVAAGEVAPDEVERVLGPMELDPMQAAMLR